MSDGRHAIAPDGGHGSLQAEQYNKGTLDASQLSPSPYTQFSSWFSSASSSSVHQPETVCLSTCELPSGRVSARMVYLKEMDASGWIVYSNFGTSRKASDLASNARAALTFWWREQERQVRVEGTAERLSAAESQTYFDARIRTSRVGAWASEQSKVLEGGREELEERVREVEARFPAGEDGDGQGGHIPVPEFWGGLRVKPDMVEFWQGRPSRLHDRFRYTPDGTGGWKIERLSP